MATTEERVSRRRLLKRAGVGAAAVGAGSMLTAPSASAATAPSAVECIHSGGCGLCGTASECVEDPGCCLCWITTEGCCICGESSMCDPHRNGASSNDCPAGYACAHTCCGTVCVPTCGTCDHFTECCNAGASHVAGVGTDRGAGASGGAHHEEAPTGGGHGHH
jgi:hypothetical protein